MIEMRIEGRRGREISDNELLLCKVQSLLILRQAVQVIPHFGEVPRFVMFCLGSFSILKYFTVYFSFCWNDTYYG